MSLPTWGFVRQAVHATRGYESALEGGLLLLRYTEENARHLGRREYDTNLQRLYSFILGLLDRLDHWEEYLAAWETIRTQKALALPYARRARHARGPRFEPFILWEKKGVLGVHFLWLTVHRKEVIERKLRRKGTGRSVEHLKHASQEELSDAEIERRLAWIVAMANRAATKPEGRPQETASAIRRRSSESS